MIKTLYNAADVFGVPIRIIDKDVIIDYFISKLVTIEDLVPVLVFIIACLADSYTVLHTSCNLVIEQLYDNRLYIFLDT